MVGTVASHLWSLSSLQQTFRDVSVAVVNPSWPFYGSWLALRALLHPVTRLYMVEGSTIFVFLYLLLILHLLSIINLFSSSSSSCTCSFSTSCCSSVVLYLFLVWDLVSCMRSLLLVWVLLYHISKIDTHGILSLLTPEALLAYYIPCLSDIGSVSGLRRSRRA